MLIRSPYADTVDEAVALYLSTGHTRCVDLFVYLFVFLLLVSLAISLLQRTLGLKKLRL